MPPDEVGPTVSWDRPGSQPPGHGWAGQVRHFPSSVLRVRYRDGVAVNPAGAPDWEPLARVVLRLPEPLDGLTVDEVRVLDVLTANHVMVATGDPLWEFTTTDPTARTPAGWTWVHVFATRDVALVPADAYAAFRHWGGVATLTIPRTAGGPRFPSPAGLHSPTEPHSPTQVAVTWDDTLAETHLDQAEQALGYRLPDAYRAFLAATNGARPTAPGVHPSFGFVADQPLFGVGRADRHQDVVYLSSLFADRFTDEYLPAGYVQGGLLAVKVRGDDVDSVWFHDGDDYRDDDSYDAAYIRDHLLGRVADDVDAFLRSLSTPPDRLAAEARRAAAAGEAVEVSGPRLGTSLPARMRSAPRPERATAPPEPAPLPPPEPPTTPVPTTFPAPLETPVPTTTAAPSETGPPLVVPATPAPPETSPSPTGPGTTQWAQFQRGLAAELAELGEHDVVVVSRRGAGAGYVQFAQRRDHVRAEVTSNAFLPAERALDATAQLRLVQAGWRPPDGQNPNWWLKLPWPATSTSYRRLAAMAVTALRDAYGAAEPSELAYDAWTDPGTPRELPRLGLARTQANVAT